MPVPSEMKFGHIGLYVTDINAMINFYTDNCVSLSAAARNAAAAARRAALKIRDTWIIV